MILGAVGLADTIAGGFITGAMVGGGVGALIGIGVAVAAVFRILGELAPREILRCLK